MKIVLAGASGFLGTALREQLASNGHNLTQLVRHKPESAGQARWDPDRGELDASVLSDADALINLGGAPIAHWPWTTSYKRKILDSRIATTGTVARAIAELGDRPALVNASGIDYYGDRGDELVSEETARGSSYLSEVTRLWEAATTPASEAGARVAIIRTSVVLDRSGGALKTMLLPFRLGVGGRLGSGRQWFPTISLHDYVAAVQRLATDPSLSGPFNVVAPVPATNADFTAALGERLRRPTVLGAPEFAIKAALGDLSQQVLGSIRATPRRLMEAGFEFAHPTVEDQLTAALAQRSP